MYIQLCDILVYILDTYTYQTRACCHTEYNMCTYKHICAHNLAHYMNFNTPWIFEDACLERVAVEGGKPAQASVGANIRQRHHLVYRIGGRFTALNPTKCEESTRNTHIKNYVPEPMRGAETAVQHTSDQSATWSTGQSHRTLTTWLYRFACRWATPVSTRTRVDLWRWGELLSDGWAF